MKVEKGLLIIILNNDGKNVLCLKIKTITKV